MMPPKKTKILVEDDDEHVRMLLHKMPAGQERRILVAEKGRKAIQVFRRERTDITILDLRMPDMSGLDGLKEIHALDPSATVIVFTGAIAETLEQQARELEASDFVAKGGSLRPLGQFLNLVV